MWTRASSRGDENALKGTAVVAARFRAPARTLYAGTCLVCELQLSKAITPKALASGKLLPKPKENLQAEFW
jgi:hypothetical protein